MRFLADENFPRPSILILRRAGFDVASVAEDYDGAKDEWILSHATSEDRIILTFDSDFGTLIFQKALLAPSAVVYFRYKGRSPRFAAEALLLLLANIEYELSGNFTVIEKNNIRQRKLTRTP